MNGSGVNRRHRLTSGEGRYSSCVINKKANGETIRFKFELFYAVDFIYFFFLLQNYVVLFVQLNNIYLEKGLHLI